MASCASSKACQSRSPISAAPRVESTMSVNSTVASTRSSATSAWCPGEELGNLLKRRTPGFHEVIPVAPRQLNGCRALSGRGLGAAMALDIGGGGADRVIAAKNLLRIRQGVRSNLCVTSHHGTSGHTED